MIRNEESAGGTPVSRPREHAFHGELGVLAYDELADRIQCHVCGGWYRRLTLWHLRCHGLDAWYYKETFGLSVIFAPRPGPQGALFTLARQSEHAPLLISTGRVSAKTRSAAKRGQSPRKSECVQTIPTPAADRWSCLATRRFRPDGSPA